MRRLEPGEAVALGLVGMALAADVALIRREHLTISSCVRGCTVAKIVVLGLTAHLLFALPFDPLTWLGRRVTRRT